jgi:imidazoleglycerol phosphate synthase glutamine amidotransferase subunit HisH
MEIAKDKDPMEVLTDDKVIIPGMTAYHTVMQPGTGDLQVKESCLLN